jgi:hypothetical protein
MVEWMDMGTAPKGGGADTVTSPDWVEPPFVLLKFRDGQKSVARWDWYFADGGRGCVDGCAWIEPVSGEQLNQHYGQPTQWAHLP